VSLAFDEGVTRAEATKFGGQPVLHDGTLVGATTVVVHSPRVGRSIGYARVDSTAARLGTSLLVDGKQGRAAATVVTRPFYDPSKKIAKA